MYNNIPGKVHRGDSLIGTPYLTPSSHAQLNEGQSGKWKVEGGRRKVEKWVTIHECEATRLNAETEATRFSKTKVSYLTTYATSYGVYSLPTLRYTLELTNMILEYGRINLNLKVFQKEKRKKKRVSKIKRDNGSTRGVLEYNIGQQISAFMFITYMYFLSLSLIYPIPTNTHLD